MTEPGPADEEDEPTVGRPQKEREPRNKRITVRVTNSLYVLLRKWREQKALSDLVNALLWAYTKKVDHHGELSREAAQEAAEPALANLEDRDGDNQ